MPFLRGPHPAGARLAPQAGRGVCHAPGTAEIAVQDGAAVGHCGGVVQVILVAPKLA